MTKNWRLRLLAAAILGSLWLFSGAANAGDVYMKALEHARNTANASNSQRETKAAKAAGITGKTAVFAIDQHQTMHLESCVILQDARRKSQKINRLTYEEASAQGFIPCKKCLAPAQKNDDEIDELGK